MKILIMGATGGSGRAAAERLVAEGHEVTAFSRRGVAVAPGVRVVSGDAMNPGDVARAVAGHDAVIVTLGITESPLRVRLFGPRHTPAAVRSVGTRNVIAAMQAHGVRRLVVQTTFGVGATRDRLGWLDALFFALLLKPQIADTEVQNREVSESGLEWVIAQPVHLTDDADDDMPFASVAGETGRLKVSRRSVARFLARAATSAEFVGREVALSGPVAPASAPARLPG
jgi:uncharacterized protein YbjT (DUF2867 family)